MPGNLDIANMSDEEFEIAKLRGDFDGRNNTADADNDRADGEANDNTDDNGHSTSDNDEPGAIDDNGNDANTEKELLENEDEYEEFNQDPNGDEPEVEGDSEDKSNDDGNSDTNGEPNSDSTTPDNSEQQVDFEPKVLSIDGKEYSIDTPEQLEQLAVNGLRYSQKIAQAEQAVALQRSLAKNGLTDSRDINMVIAAINGDKGAMINLLERANIEFEEEDFADMDKWKNYNPDNYILSPEEVKLDEIVTSFQSSPKEDAIVSAINSVDDESMDFLASNPDMLVGLKEDVESGVYYAVMAEVDKMKALGKLPRDATFVQAYAEAGPIIAERLAQNRGEKAEDKKENKGVSGDNQPDKGAVVKTTSSSKSGRPNPHKRSSEKRFDVASMSDEEFKKYKRDVLGRL